MKHFTALFLTVSLLFMSLAATGAQAAPGFDGTIRLSGSTTLLPVIAAGSRQFMEKYQTWNKVDPSLPNVPINIYVNGGGSGIGIKAATDGTVNIGIASRNLKAKEKAQLGRHEEYLISKDCLAFAVNKKNPLAKLDNVTRSEMARIYSGEAKTFKDIDPSLPARPILVEMRDAAGGSTAIVKKKVLQTKNFTPHAVQVPSQGAGLKMLEQNPSAIAYLSSALVMHNPKIKVFKYEGVMPTNANVINGRYQLSRPLLLIVKGTPDTASLKFIDFMLNDGQKIVVKHGYVPVKTVQ
jgi:phosphate transport system substrate-binding protein